MYRLHAGVPEFFLVHPGGPFWQKKDAGTWSIPKGELAAGEDPLAAAQREFSEELGSKPQGDFIALTPIKQKSGKLVRAWAFAGDCDPAACKSNTFQLEWPPRSGRMQDFPEIDRAEWFDLSTARQKINPAQAPFLDELLLKIQV
jgi:predicted NUDIX family NTP pyrophosphohydrolase